MPLIKRWLTLDTLWALIVPAGLLMCLNLSRVYPNDFWWHVRVGQIIVTEGYIPTTDLFSFTRFGQPWVNQAWLMQVALYLLYQAGGLPLVILMHALTITAGYCVLLRVVMRYHGLRVAVLAALVGASVGVLNWAPRPQTVSYLFFGLLIYLIENHRHGRLCWLWGVLPLFAVWVNAHGGFVFGIAVLGFYVLGRLGEFWRAGLPAEQRRATLQLMGIGLLALAMLALNPQGPLGLVKYVVGFLQSTATTQYNVEFEPLVIRQLDGALFFTSLLLLLLLMLRSGFRPRVDQALGLLAFIFLALSARRNAPWYGFVLAPVFAGALKSFWKPAGVYPGKVALNGIVVCALAAGVLITIPWWRGNLPVPDKQRSLVTELTPLAAADVLCSTLPDGARVYQYLAFSSYQIWACPRLPVFIDTRFELYPLEQWLEYVAIERGRFDWESVVAKYQITHLFLSPEFQEHAVKVATASECWQETYRDKQAVIFEKTCP